MTLRCERCGHVWEALEGELRREYVAALLELSPAEILDEDVDFFGDDCQRCGAWCLGDVVVDEAAAVSGG